MLPIILAHGYLGFAKLASLSYFNNIANLFSGVGVDVFATAVPPVGSLKDRSASLYTQIREHVPSGKVHVIAHSMGGLDVRYLIANGKGRDLVRTMTTLGSPFTGTLAADIAVDPSHLSQVNPARLLEAITSYAAALVLKWPILIDAGTHFAIQQLRSAADRMLQGDYSAIRTYFTDLFTLPDTALGELTTASCKQMFPENCSDLVGVDCYSYAGLLPPVQVSPILTVPALVLEAVGQPNDGLVPVSSATIPNSMGVLPVDHLGLVGWSPIDVSGYYRQILKTLAAY